MARPFKSAGRHACNCLIPSRHAISISCQKPQTTASALFRPHSTIQVIPEVTPEASALFLNNSTSGLHARWRYLVYPILAPDRELLVLRFGFLYHGGRLFCQNTVNQAAISKSRDRHGCRRPGWNSVILLSWTRSSKAQYRLFLLPTPRNP